METSLVSSQLFRPCRLGFGMQGAARSVEACGARPRGGGRCQSQWRGLYACQSWYGLIVGTAPRPALNTGTAMSGSLGGAGRCSRSCVLLLSRALRHLHRPRQTSRRHRPDTSFPGVGSDGCRSPPARNRRRGSVFLNEGKSERPLEAGVLWFGGSFGFGSDRSDSELLGECSHPDDHADHSTESVSAWACQQAASDGE